MSLPSTPVSRLSIRRPAVFAVLGILLALAAPASPALAQSPAPEESPTASPGPSRSPLSQRRPVLGILGFSAPDGRGVTIARVVPQTGADDAGLQAGDLITEIEGTRVSAMEDLTTAMESFNVGDDVTISYERNGESRTAEVKLGSGEQVRRRSPFEVIPDPDFGLDEPRQPADPVQPASDVDYRPVITLFGLLITGALVALIVLLVRKNRPATPPADASATTTTAYVPPASATRADPLEVLRMRYAKGEISREEFLNTSADLAGPASPPSESPTQEL